MRKKRQLSLIPNTATRKQWVAKIIAAWRSSVGGILETGRLLTEAKAELEHGEFEAMIESDLPFGARTTQMLMKISHNSRFAKAKYTSLLPPNWYCLYQLTKLSDEEFERRIGDGTIRSDMRQADINKVVRLERVREDEQRVLSLRPVPGKFRTLVFDPAWEYDWLSLAGRAKPGYAMQSPEQLLALDVKQWVDENTGTQLYVWTTNNFMARACELVAHWGFQHRTLITWIKPPPFGLGSYFRNSTEHVLFATLGETTTRHAAASMPTHFEAPRGEHSEKPEVFYDMVRAASYPPYGEGNQREPRPDFVNLFASESVDAEAAE